MINVAGRVEFSCLVIRMVNSVGWKKENSVAQYIVIESNDIMMTDRLARESEE
jgi:hypothetical protein